MASLVTIATYYDLSEALIARALLEQHGFTVFLQDRFYTSLDWSRLFALGGLRLAVPDPEADDAVHLLSLVSPVPDSEMDPIDRCPDCGSDNVFRYAHWLSALVTLMTGIVTIFIGWSKRRRCRICGHRWRI